MLVPAVHDVYHLLNTTAARALYDILTAVSMTALILHDAHMLRICCMACSLKSLSSLLLTLHYGSQRRALLVLHVQCHCHQLLAAA